MIQKRPDRSTDGAQTDPDNDEDMVAVESESDDDPRSGRSGGTPTPVLEWILAAAGLILISGVIGFLIYRGTGDERLPPEIVLTVDTLLPSSGRYLLRIRGANTGGETVADLVVEGELLADTGIVEVSAVTIPFLPSESERTAGLFFDNDPARYRLVLRPKAFNDP